MGVAGAVHYPCGGPDVYSGHFLHVLWAVSDDSPLSLDSSFSPLPPLPTPRLLSPLALRQFLRWISDYKNGEDPPQYQGWLLALALGAGGVLVAVLHHRLFW